jgi:hypothetical protein
VDLVTANSGGNNGLREATDAVIALLGNGREVIDHRVQYSETYQRYLSERQAVVPEIVRNPADQRKSDPRGLHTLFHHHR